MLEISVYTLRRQVLFFAHHVTNFTNHRSISNTAIGLSYPLIMVVVPALKYPATIVLLIQPLSWKEFKNLTSIICYKSYKVHATTINSCPYSAKHAIRNFFVISIYTNERFDWDFALPKHFK